MERESGSTTEVLCGLSKGYAYLASSLEAGLGSHLSRQPPAPQHPAGLDYCISLYHHLGLGPQSFSPGLAQYLLTPEGCFKT